MKLFQKLLCKIGIHKHQEQPYTHAFNPDWEYDGDYGCIQQIAVCPHCRDAKVLYFETWRTIDCMMAHVDEVYPRIIESTNKLNSMRGFPIEGQLSE